MLDGLHGNRGGQMRFTRTGAAHEHDILGIVDKLAAVQ